MHDTTHKQNGTTKKLAGVVIGLALLLLVPEASAQINSPNQDAATAGATTLALELSGTDACSNGYGRNRASELSCGAIPELMAGYGFSSSSRTEFSLSVAYWTADMLLNFVEDDDDDDPLGMVRIADVLIAATASTINRDGRINGAAVGLIARF